MNNRTLKTFLAAALLGQAAALSARQPAAPNASGFINCSIYGEDDRQEFYEADAIMQKLAGSTAALFKDSDIPLNDETGKYELRQLSLKDKYNLKPGEKFAAQTVGAFCSAALVGEDLVLTSGHCFKPDSRGGPCERVKFVFGYALTAEGKAVTSFGAGDVYSCSQIKAQRVMDEVSNFACKGGACKEAALAGLGPDWALVKLDRKVKGRHPLAVSRKAVATGARLTAIGYPSGLPVKIAPNGKVRSVAAGYFVTDLDTFGGNSGGPVFNPATFKIEGVLSRGGKDYVYGSGTPVEDPAQPYFYEPGQAQVYSQEGGRGEDVTFASEFENFIPKTEMETYLDKVNQRASQPQVMPAIYVPGTNERVQPAIYYAPPAPVESEPTWI